MEKIKNNFEKYNKDIIQKYPFLDDYKVRPLSNNSFVNNLIFIFLVCVILIIIFEGLLKIIFIIVAITSGLFIFANYYHRLNSKWARIHYSVWVQYSRACGATNYFASGNPSKKDFEEIALPILMKSLFYKTDKEKLSNLLQDILKKREMLSDKGYLTNIFKYNLPEQKKEVINKMVNATYEDIKNPKSMATHNRLNISLIIGTLIGVKYNQIEEQKYYVNVFLGKAN